MPRIRVNKILWDGRNTAHATQRASKAQIESILLGWHDASRNKKGRAAKYTLKGVAYDGTTWEVKFNFSGNVARPITAFKSK